MGTIDTKVILIKMDYLKELEWENGLVAKKILENGILIKNKAAEK